MTGITSILEASSGPLWFGFVVFLRVGAMMATLPTLGEQVISVRVRLVMAIMLTAATAPAVADRVLIPDPELSNLVSLLATETVSGLTLGLALRLFVLALQTAGAIAAQSTSLAQLLGNSAADPMPAIGHILIVSAFALLMATGFHIKAAAFVILSYELFPVGVFPSPSAIANWGRGHVAQAFALAFTLAAPFVILSMLYNLTLGVINKAMPQLMVAFVGAPVITLGSIVMLLLSAPLMLQVWLEAVDLFLSNPFGFR